jgi:plastocyanin
MWPFQQRPLGSSPLKRGIFGFLVVGFLLIGSLAIAAPSALRITMGTFAPYYSPPFVHINTSTSISWNNPTGALHSITHDECKNGARCAFDSGPLGPNSTFTLHQLSPGSYSYHCSFHPIMRGLLVVQEPDRPHEA